MGVMSCNRRGCNSIMCAMYSSKYGYICHDCFEELVRTGPTTDIEEFMQDNVKRSDTYEEAYARYSTVFTSN